MLKRLLESEFTLNLFVIKTTTKMMIFSSFVYPEGCSKFEKTLFSLLCLNSFIKKKKRRKRADSTVILTLPGMGGQ